MGQRIAKKIVWIGWDAADWKIINPLLDEGLMPNLEKLINGGVMGNLATLDPPMSPTLWTAMSTGKRPYKHGIHGFTEIDPSGQGVRPSYITSRKVKAIWNMLMHHDMVTHQVGWWPSHPAEPINGIYISNFWHKAGKNPKKWPLKDGCVHPKSVEHIFKNLRIHPHELTYAHIQPFIPNGHEMDQSEDKFKKLVGSVKKITADAASIQAAATYIMSNHEYDLMCVYFDSIDHYGHGFMKYHPPRRPHINEDLYKFFNYVNIAGYRYHDMMLGRLIQLAGEDATVILVSDHGFHPDHLRPVNLPIKEEPAAPALEHSPFGIIVAKGPNIKKDEIIYGASLIDLCPTILSMLGLPIARDFDGKVLMNLFENNIDIDIIDSWENIEGECGQHKTKQIVDIESAKDEMRQLIDLGYIEDPGDNLDKALENTRKTNKYFLARAFVDGGRIEDALPLYEELWEEYRDNYRFGVRLANCYISLDKIEEARETIEHVKELKLEDSASMEILDGIILMKESKTNEALIKFESAFVKSPKSLGINLHLAKAFFQLKRMDEAYESVQKELEKNFDNAEAHFLLGKICLQKKELENAKDHFLTAIGLRYHFPQAHFFLGMVFNRSNDYQSAINALKISLKQFPGFNRARLMLLKVYSSLGMDDEIEQLKTRQQNIEVRKTKLLIAGYQHSKFESQLSQLMDSSIEVSGIIANNLQIESILSGKLRNMPKHVIRADKSIIQQMTDSDILGVYVSELPFLPKKFLYKLILIEEDVTTIMNNISTENAQDTANLFKLMNMEKKIERIHKWLGKQKNFFQKRIASKDLESKFADQLMEIKTFLSHSV